MIIKFDLTLAPLRKFEIKQNKMGKEMLSQPMLINSIEFHAKPQIMWGTEMLFSSFNK